MVGVVKVKDYSKPKCVEMVYGSWKTSNKLKKKKKKSEEGNIVKNIRNLFKPKNEAIKGRIIREIKTLFEQENHYYKPIRVGNVWNNNNIEDEINGDRNKNLAVKEYLKEIKPYFEGHNNWSSKIWYVKNSVNNSD